MPTCSNCGEVVSPAFARVFGDNEGTIHGCVNCRSSRELGGPGDDETVPRLVQI